MDWQVVVRSQYKDCESMTDEEITAYIQEAADSGEVRGLANYSNLFA